MLLAPSQAHAHEELKQDDPWLSTKVIYEPWRSSSPSLRLVVALSAVFFRLGERRVPSSLIYALRVGSVKVLAYDDCYPS